MAHNGDDMQIRPISSGDLRDILALNYAPLIKERDTIYLLIAQDHGRYSYIARDADGEALGVVLATGASDGSAVFVLKLWVQPKRRSGGVGGALMDRLEAAAEDAGVGRIWLLSTRDAVAFYERRGYARRTDFLHPDAAAYLQDIKKAPVLAKDLQS